MIAISIPMSRISIAWFRHTAHGTRKELVGKSLYEFRDQDGKFVARDTVEVAKTSGRGWTDFRWTNPTTGQVEAKWTYVEKLGDRYAVGVGIYKDEQVNGNTVAIISGSPSFDATYLQVAFLRRCSTTAKTCEFSRWSASAVLRTFATCARSKALISA